MNKFFTQFILLTAFVYAGFLNLVHAQTPATLPYSQNFSTANDFTFVNGTQTNKWSYGTATGNAASETGYAHQFGSTCQPSPIGGVPAQHRTDGAPEARGAAQPAARPQRAFVRPAPVRQAGTVPRV